VDPSLHVHSRILWLTRALLRLLLLRRRRGRLLLRRLCLRHSGPHRIHLPLQHLDLALKSVFGWEAGQLCLDLGLAGLSLLPLLLVQVFA